MDRDEYIQQALAQSQGDPLGAWRWAYFEREKNPDPQLANAEHYLWAQNYAGEGPVQAISGLLAPLGYYAGKKLGLLGARSPASLDQMTSGIAGAFKGMGI